MERDVDRFRDLLYRVCVLRPGLLWVPSHRRCDNGQKVGFRRSVRGRPGFNWLDNRSREGAPLRIAVLDA